MKKAAQGGLFHWRDEFEYSRLDRDSLLLPLSSGNHVAG